MLVRGWTPLFPCELGEKIGELVDGGEREIGQGVAALLAQHDPMDVSAPSAAAMSGLGAKPGETSSELRLDFGPPSKHGGFSGK